MQPRLIIAPKRSVSDSAEGRVRETPTAVIACYPGRAILSREFVPACFSCVTRAISEQ